MSIEGRIVIDVSFSDSSAETGVQSQKRITLTDTANYSSGKVAVVTGTMTTAGVSINSADLSYRDAAGQLVAISPVSRLAFLCSRDATAVDDDNSLNRVRSNGVAGVSSWNPDGATISLAAQFTAGTASYTLVLYGT